MHLSDNSPFHQNSGKQQLLVLMQQQNNLQQMWNCRLTDKLQRASALWRTSVSWTETHENVTNTDDRKNISQSNLDGILPYLKNHSKTTGWTKIAWASLTQQSTA